MVCKFCRKETYSMGDVCVNCAQKQREGTPTPVSNTAGASGSAPSYPSSGSTYGGSPSITDSYGRGMAIAATVMGAIALLFAIIGLANSASVANALSNIVSLLTSTKEGIALSYVGGFVFCFLGLGLGIPSLVMGIKSINRFKYAKRNGANPTATFALGLTGLICGGLAILFFIVSINLLASIADKATKLLG